VGPQTQINELRQTSNAPWNLAERVSFRFCFTYLGLFCITTQILGDLLRLPTFFFPPLATIWPMRQIVLWTATHIFRITHPLVYAGSGSGDKTFDWIEAFCLLVLAVLSTAIWAVLDRRRGNYVTVDKWFRLFIRFALAGQMFSYGIAKLIPLQMPFPFLTRFVEPFGNFTPMGVLWNSIGSSPTYEIFTGCAETLAGILLIVPRTTTLGAMLCLADLIEVFILNMTYDVPVKLLSFHLILMALFVLAPEVPRLVNFLLLNRSVGPSTQPQLFSTHRANHLAATAQIAFGICLAGMALYSSWIGWYAFGDGRTKSPFYGIWNVDELAIDGKEHPALLSDTTRWRRLIFDFPTSVNFQGMDDSFAGYGAAINAKDKTIALTKTPDKNWRANFIFNQPAENELVLDGQMDGHTIRMKLQLVNLHQYPLGTHKFHWIAEYPFNRLEVRR
jgi:hypothetical protein